MKAKLNILCVLIFIAIGASCFNYLDNHWGDFSWGFTMGSKSAQCRFDESNSVVTEKNADAVHFLQMNPVDRNAFTDTIYNGKTGEKMPVQYRNIVVEQDTGLPMGLTPWEMFFTMLMSFVALGAYFTQLVTFVLLIVAINKSVIFAWSNVWKLRIIGFAMLVAFLANAVFNYISYQSVLTHFSISGYELTNTEIWDFYLLIPGLGLLLMAEIFAIGLKLKEEQELTI